METVPVKRNCLEEAAPESLIGLLEKQSSVQTEIETERTPDEDELGEYGAVQNLKHREKKLDESCSPRIL